MKTPIKLHKLSLRNMKASYVQAERYIQREQDRLDRIGDAIQILERQINLAEKRGLTEFDAGKLGYLKGNYKELSHD